MFSETEIRERYCGEYSNYNWHGNYNKFFCIFTNEELSVDFMRELFYNLLNEKEREQFISDILKRMKKIAYYYSRDTKIIAFDMDNIWTDKNIMNFIKYKVSNNNELYDYLGIAEYKFFSGKYEYHEKRVVHLVDENGLIKESIIM